MQHKMGMNEYAQEACVVCGGSGGTLPTECPETYMTDDFRAAVHAGVLDFVEGAWCSSTSVNSPEAFKGTLLQSSGEIFSFEDELVDRLIAAAEITLTALKEYKEKRGRNVDKNNSTS